MSIDRCQQHQHAMRFLVMYVNLDIGTGECVEEDSLAETASCYSSTANGLGVR